MMTDSMLMLPNKLFERIHTRDNYRHIGKDLSYKFYIDRVNKVFYVCFQGSNGLLDWFHNLLAIPVKMRDFCASLFDEDHGAEEYEEGCGWKVHKGFRRAWLSGNETVMEELRMFTERPQLEGFRIVFSGFSHGGPQAMLGAKNWFDLTGNKCRCEIFGSPRLAHGEDAVRVLNNAMDLICWINPADIVTTLPFDGWGFKHVKEDILNVKRIPFLSKLFVWKHHQIYDRPEIYPQDMDRTA